MTEPPDTAANEDHPSAGDLAYLGLEPGGGPGRYRLPVVGRLCTPFEFLYGGSGMAACLAAAEHHTGWPVSWLTVQYVSNAFPGEVVELEVTVPAKGRVTAQVEVVGQVGDRRVVTATGAVTGRPRDRIHWWGSMPEVPPPLECQVLRLPFEDRIPVSISTSMERRLALGDGAPTDGRVALWSRTGGWDGPSAARLGYLADIIPLALNIALQQEHGGTSLDNTIRMMDRRLDDGDDWVLLDVEAQGYAHSIGHGQVRLWSPSGRLLALAEQSCILRTSHHGRERSTP